MVNIIIELLHVFHLKISAENYENIVKCLDTLNEFI